MTHDAGGRQTAYWIPRAWVGDEAAERVRLTIADGRFTAVETGVEPRPDDIRFRGMAIPGAANCHSHTFHRALRGLGKEGSTFWSWRDTMYRVAANLTPELYGEYAKAVYGEMLLAGYTTVAEFHYVHHRPDGTPYEDPNAFGLALARAAHEVGIRLTLLDACYLHANPQGESLNERQRRFGDADVYAWRDRVIALDAAVQADPLLSETTIVGAAAHSVRACNLDEARVIAQWTRNAGPARPLHVHLSEQPAENEACMTATGMTPAGLLAQADFWGPNAVAVHATHLSDEDVRILGESHAFAAICPTTEADLADGIPRAADLSDAGVRLCVGSDENVSIDPFEEIRRLDGNQRLVSGRRDTFDPAGLMAMMVRDGQSASGWSDAGDLRVGGLADFVVVDTSRVALAGVRPDSVPMVASAADVTDTFVAGRRVVADGRLVADAGADPTEAIAELTAQFRQSGGDAR